MREIQNAMHDSKSANRTFMIWICFSNEKYYLRFISQPLRPHGVPLGSWQKLVNVIPGSFLVVDTNFLEADLEYIVRCSFTPKFVLSEELLYFLSFTSQGRLKIRIVLQGVLAHHGFILHGFRPPRFFLRIQFLTQHKLVQHSFFQVWFVKKLHFNFDSLIKGCKKVIKNFCNQH